MEHTISQQIPKNNSKQTNYSFQMQQKSQGTHWK